MPTSTVPSLAADLRVALGRANRRVRAERGSAGLSDPQFSVLALLTRNGSMTPGQLAEADRVQPPTMTRTVSCLADLGLVVKAEHPSDGRQVVVSLTDRGQAEVRETRRRRDVWLTAQLTAMTPDERDVLARAAVLLRRIAAQ